MSRTVSLPRRTFLGRLGAAAVVAAAPRFTAWGADDAAEADKALQFHSRSPNNAEPAHDALVQAWITPYEQFYIRSHGPNPQIDAQTFAVSVEGLVRKPQKLSVAQLREGFPQTTVTATLTCAGNRRNEHSATKPIAGVPWDAGAVGNATWGGVPLAEILQRAELLEGARHVWFEGVDQVEVHGEKTLFGGSIPLDKALARHGATPGCLVAWKMNDAPLRPDHGFPVRTVVPGYIGARSVKWLGRIVVSDRPSPNHFVAEAYKLITADTPEQVAAAEPIYQYPINAAIGQPAAGAALRPGKTVVKGYALPPGEPGRTIARVELSLDGGATWRPARLDEHSAPFCWRLWSADVDLPPGTTHLAVRAIDSAGESQPTATPWNAKGYLYNGWHHRQVTATG